MEDPRPLCCLIPCSGSVGGANEVLLDGVIIGVRKGGDLLGQGEHLAAGCVSLRPSLWRDHWSRDIDGKRRRLSDIILLQVSRDKPTPLAALRDWRELIRVNCLREP